MRQNISSGTPWEAKFGYSRAVKLGNLVFVSGTTASDENGQVVGIDDPYEQTVYAIKKIETALQTAGATLNDVVRTRVFTTDIRFFEDVTRAHGEFFGEIRPASTFVEVSKLIAPAHLIEIEVDAVISDESGSA